MLQTFAQYGPLSPSEQSSLWKWSPGKLSVMLFDSLLPHIHTGNEGGSALSPAERPPEILTVFNDRERNTGWGRLWGGEPSTGRQLRLLVLTLQAELCVASRDPVLHLLQVLVRPTLELSASEQNQDHQLQDGRRRPGDGSGCPFTMKANFLLFSQMKNNEIKMLKCVSVYNPNN